MALRSWGAGWESSCCGCGAWVEVEGTADAGSASLTVTSRASLVAMGSWRGGAGVWVVGSSADDVGRGMFVLSCDGASG